MDIKFFISDLWACGHVRGEVVARYINSQTAHRMVCKSDVMYSDMFKTDVMVFQRQCNQSMLPYAQQARKIGIKVVYETDDDLFSIPPEHAKPYKFYSRPDVQNGMESFMAASDAITVSTGELAMSTRKHTDRPIFIVENCVDFDLWHRLAMESRRRDAGVVTIGWMASGSHVFDAPLIRRILPGILRRHPNVRVHLIGWVSKSDVTLFEIEGQDTSLLEDEFKDRIKVDPWIDISELPAAMSDFDIGICPLIDNQFNRCKSGVKHLQYSALGIPSVCSPVAPYLPLIADGVDGFIAEGNTPEAWTEKLEKLIDDEELRKGIGEAAMLHMRRRYDVSVVAHHWITTFEAICASPWRRREQQ